MTSVSEALLWPSLPDLQRVVKLFQHGVWGIHRLTELASQTSDDVSMLTAGGREVGHNYSSDYNYDDLWTKSWERVL